MHFRPETSALPAAAIAGSVNEALEKSGVLVVTAPPGAGKSTFLPLSVLEGLKGAGKILVNEPRRLAAKQIASRMSWMLGEPVGTTVGYRIRFESNVSADTAIEVITEGIMASLMMDDPTLDGVAAVIFDEFHERSLFCDEALAMALKIREELRPDLRIVIMSATIDASQICAFLRAPLVNCGGRCFPVDIKYGDVAVEPQDCAVEVARAAVRAVREYEGDILAFLPGEADICKAADLLAAAFTADEGDSSDIEVCPLYGQLSFERQNRAIAPSAEGRRKIVLSTPIAETSLTIEGVRVVVDSGLYRKLVYNPQTCQSHLETVRVSRDMADQRAGRAGRVSAGVCLRLYPERVYRSFSGSRIPEIQEADLLPLALDLAVFGTSDLPWLTPPDEWKLSRARSVLFSMGAVDENGKLTSVGKRMSGYACHPRLARMLCVSDGTDTNLAACLAALIGERDPLPTDSYGTDICVRVDALNAYMKGKSHPAGNSRRWELIAKAARQYGWKPEGDVVCGTEGSGGILSGAFPERIGKACGDGRFMLACGDCVRIDREDVLSSSDWIVALSANVQPGQCGRVLLACKVEQACLMKTARVTDRLVWEKGAVVARREWRTGVLTVHSIPVQNVPQEEVHRLICSAARRNGVSMLDFSEEVGNLQRRVAAVSSWHPELRLPDLSADAVLERADEWLPMYIGKSRTSAELRKIDLAEALWNLLDYSQQQAVERLAPSYITVPSGSRIRVEYRQGADAPVLRVRLQECFSLADTPRVDDGKRPVLMELLSPGFKPVQLTADLAHFWAETYFEVRKELRRRYPRHFWPDNPLEAPAVRGVRKK